MFVIYCSYYYFCERLLQWINNIGYKNSFIGQEDETAAINKTEATGVI